MTDFSDLEADAEGADEVTALKRRNATLARQLYDIKHRHADYLATVEQAVKDAMEGIELAQVPPPSLNLRPIPSGGGEEYAVPLFSDLQTGKITPDYNSDICRTRVMRYAEKIIRLTDIQRADHPVHHCHIAALGDLIEGVDIFPGQQWLIDSTLYRQVFETTPSIIVDFVRTLLGHFDTVTMHAVQGNHGRIGRKGMFGPEDNADRMVHRVAQMLLQGEPRFTMDMADPAGERAWYKIMELGTYRALLIHGDQIRGHSGFPWYGLGKKVQGWGSGGLGADSDFRDVLMGHYHQAARVPLNHRAVYCNGSTESTNTFAAENLAAQSDPSQWLLFVDPDKGRVTASYVVDLKEGEE